MIRPDCPIRQIGRKKRETDMRKAAAFLAAVLGAAFLSGAATQTTQPTLVPTPKVKTETVPIASAAAGQQTGAHALTADDVNVWLDGFMPYAIGKGDIPGTVVVVVKDGKVLTERGYGYADVAKKTKVDPKTTL